VSSWFYYPPFSEDVGNLVTYTGTGGLVFSGVAPHRLEIVHAASGGLVFGGAAGIVATILLNVAYTGEGGLVLGGIGPHKLGIVHGPSGGITIDGEAPHSALVVQAYVYVGEGGIVISGEAGILAEIILVTHFPAVGGYYLKPGRTLRFTHKAPLSEEEKRRLEELRRKQRRQEILDEFEALKIEEMIEARARAVQAQIEGDTEEQPIVLLRP
jgi:hypothetical protein